MTRRTASRGPGVMVSIVRWLRKTMSFRRAAAVILGVVAIASATAVPLKVTVDGILYLSSAKALFKSTFARDYAWFREPGYPFFLKALHFFGDDGMFIVVAQALCLALAAFIALYAVRRVLGYTNVTVGQVIVTVFLTLNPMFLIYSGLVLQQALFALQLALFALGIVWAMNRYRPNRLSRPVLLVLVAVNFISSIWTSIGWLYLALVPVALTVILCYWPAARGMFRRAATLPWKVAGGFILAIATVALCVVVYAVGLQSYKGWEAIKAPYLQSASVPGAVIEPLSGVPNIPSVNQMTERMLALAHIGTVAPYTHENDLFLRQQMLPNWAYAQWDTAYVLKPFTSYASGYITLPNPSDIVHNVFARASVISPVVYSTMFVGFALLLLLSLIRRKWGLLLVLSVPLAFLAVYAASNSPIDRYGVPSYPWAVASVVVLLHWLGEWVTSTSQGSRFRDATERNSVSATAPSAL
jgi:hypothetical protein